MTAATDLLGKCRIIPSESVFADLSKICDLYWENERWLGEAIEWTKHHGMVIHKELFTSTKTVEAEVTTAALHDATSEAA